MIKTVKKWFWAWNDDKEEKFLENMAAEGYKLINVQLGRYFFEKTEKSKFRYQLDFKSITGIKEDEYLQIYEDAGWEYVDRLGSWYYFRKEYDGESPDTSIFSDNKSRLDKYRRIIFILLLTGFPVYYQALILFPSLEATEFNFPGFYYFFRIIIIILIIIHAIALLLLIRKIIRERRNISE